MSLNDIKNLLLRKLIKDNFKVGPPIDSSLASLTFGSGDSEITFEAQDRGTYGNSLSVSILDSAETDSDLSFSFDIISKELVIYPKKTSDSVASTCSEIATALNDDVTVSAYLSVDGGSGTIDLQSKTNLSGGVNATEGIGKFTRYVNGSDIYICFEDADYSSTGKWREISGALDYDSVLDYDSILDYDEIL